VPWDAAYLRATCCSMGTCYLPHLLDISMMAGSKADAAVAQLHMGVTVTQQWVSPCRGRLVYTCVRSLAALTLIDHPHCSNDVLRINAVHATAHTMHTRTQSKRPGHLFAINSDGVCNVSGKLASCVQPHISLCKELLDCTMLLL
jgi:hypothetical protein